MRKFMRTRAHASPPPPAHDAPPPPPPAHDGHAHKTNGHAHANGVGARRDDQHSTLSRYWSGSQEGALFEDTQFPATWRSLGDRRLAAGVTWLRPHELCARPRFRGDERVACSSDVSDDHHDHDRWYVESEDVGGACVCAAAGALADVPRLLDRAVPPHCFTYRYTGAFRFRFWVFGAWRDVTVDDRLPTRHGRLLGARSSLRDDFTLPLLHKAYAKLHGSYAALRGSSVARALQDLTGAIVQSFSLRRQPRALTFQVLNSAVPRSTLLVATLAPEDAKRARGGLVAGQAYCVTGLARVRDAGGEALVRMRAAGARAAWRGAWAPHSAEWRALPPADRDLLADRAPHPGDFWMSFEDFASSFSSLELVHVGPDDWLLEPALHARRPWRAVLARRRWRTGYNAGGPPGCVETTGANPQFLVQVPARKCHVVVSVTQQYWPASDARLHAIGFCVYELPPGAAPRRDLRPLQGLRTLDVTHECRAREVVTFFTLGAGRYAVVPHTRRAHTDASFLLRVLTDERADVWEHNDDNLLVRDLAAELQHDHRPIPAEVRAMVSKLSPDTEEVEAARLRGAGGWGRGVWSALVALRDTSLCGAVRARDVAALVALAGAWRATFRRLAARRCGPARLSSYALRAALWAAGLTVSNKVLEALVLRYAPRASLSEQRYVLALATLHLAHERYRSLDQKLKSNPLSLEEMILMTIYS